MKAGHIVLLTMLGAPLAAPANAGVCEQLESAKARLASGISAATAGVPAMLKMSGLIAFEHSSGATILAAANGTYLPHTIGAVGAAFGVLTSTPAIVVGSTAALSIGGIYVACKIVKPPTMAPAVSQAKRPMPNG